MFRDTQNMERTQAVTTAIFRYIRNMSSGKVQGKLDVRKGQPSAQRKKAL